MDISLWIKLELSTFLCLKITIYFLDLHIRSKKYIGLGQNRQKMKTGSLVNLELSNMSLKINLQIINIKIIKLKRCKYNS